MRRVISRQLRNGTLTPSSELIQITYIGPYLYRRLCRRFNSGNDLTIRRFASKIRNMSTDALKESLHISLQNNRNNECVPSRRRRGSRLYHVSDVNERGYEAMLGLVRALDEGADGYGLGNGFRFDVRRLRKPHRRSTFSKHISCTTNRRSCYREGGHYGNGLCQPPSCRNKGFHGVHGRSGQKLRAGSTATRRGRYAPSPRGECEWRRPGRMRKVGS